MVGMHVWLSVISVVIGAIIAVNIADFLTRRTVFKELVKARDEFRDNIGKMQDVHNSLASEVMEMKDRVAQHDFQLNAKLGVRTKP